MTPPLPFVTLAIPCLDEEDHIEACIASVAAQNYPRNRMEILIADGGSRDRTLEILRRLALEDPRIVVLHNPDRIQAAALNAMIRRARGDVVVRMDVHCEYAPNYVTKCVEALTRSGADNAGGPQRVQARSPFQWAVRAALSSPLGAGEAPYKAGDREGFVDTVFLGAFRRRVFETVGLFNPRAITNEDAELNQRILAAGGKVYLSPEIEARYYPRGSFTALARQYYRYGRGRARTLLKLGSLASPRSAIPFAVVASGAALLVTRRLRPLLAVASGAYVLATFAEAVRVGRGLGVSAVPVVWAIFPTLHLSHGIGFAAGLWKYGLSPDWSEPERLPAPGLLTRLLRARQTGADH